MSIVRALKKILLKIPAIRNLRLGSMALNHPLTLDANAMAEAERRKKPKRTDIINYIISLRSKPTKYLEIGVRNPEDNFSKINADCKVSVDPGVEFKSNPVDFRVSSDQFFQLLREGKALSPEYKFDVIFIDGLHAASQVDRDIRNALEFLTPDGFIVLHDCNPPTEWHARETYGYPHSPAGTDWNGTTWKAFVKWRSDAGVSTCCIDTDWGVGIISKGVDVGVSKKTTTEFYEYSDLAGDRHHILNLVTFAQFRKILSKPRFDEGTT